MAFLAILRSHPFPLNVVTVGPLATSFACVSACWLPDHSFSLPFGAQRRVVRSFASDVATIKKPTGGGLFQRLSSFLVGAGLTALGTQYYIWEELRQSNKVMIQKQKDLEARLMKLEKQ
jgi:hypothetical protein